MEDKMYNAGVMSQSFWFIEFKKMVTLVSEGKSAEEIKCLCIDENLFGAAKEYRARRMYGYIYNRVKTMTQELISLFVESDLGTQKLINLITLLRSDRLFFEFVFTVYRENVILGNPYLEDSAVKTFFNKMESQNEEISRWNESTRIKLKNCYLNFMVDANLLTIKNKKRSITPPILDAALTSYLEASGEIAILKAITGGR